MGPITIGILGAATVVTGMAVVVEWKKCKEMKRLNDLMEINLRAQGLMPDEPVTVGDINDLSRAGKARHVADELLARAGYQRMTPQNGTEAAGSAV